MNTGSRLNGDYPLPHVTILEQAAAASARYRASETFVNPYQRTEYRIKGSDAFSSLRNGWAISATSVSGLAAGLGLTERPRPRARIKRLNGVAGWANRNESRVLPLRSDDDPAAVGDGR
jgi:hypothetical protein